MSLGSVGLGFTVLFQTVVELALSLDRVPFHSWQQRATPLTRLWT